MIYFSKALIVLYNLNWVLCHRSILLDSHTSIATKRDFVFIAFVPFILYNVMQSIQQWSTLPPYNADIRNVTVRWIFRIRWGHPGRKIFICTCEAEAHFPKHVPVRVCTTHDNLWTILAVIISSQSKRLKSCHDISLTIAQHRYGTQYTSVVFVPKLVSAGLCCIFYSVKHRVLVTCLNFLSWIFFRRL